MSCATILSTQDSQLTELVRQTPDGLERLVRLIDRGTQIRHLGPWLEPALSQLEVDDVLAAETTDAIADLLLQAEAELEQNGSAQAVLVRISHLYHSATTLTTEQVWRLRAATLSEDQLKTETWLDLKAAVQAVWQGAGEEVSDWVDHMEAFYLNAWSGYESLNVMEEEVTRESVLGHLFLCEGTEFWLEALACLRDFVEQPSRQLETELWELAEDGQRLLIALQMFEMENRSHGEITIKSWN